MQTRDTVAALVHGMTDDEVAIIWRFGGFHGEPPQDRDRLICAMVRGVTRSARQFMARAAVRAYAAVRPEVRAALVALVLILVGRPAGVALPAPAVPVLSPQRRSVRITPARAP